jgi:hypothetical protein
MVVVTITLAAVSEPCDSHEVPTRHGGFAIVSTLG